MFSLVFFRELILWIAGKIAKTRNAKILCRTVSLVYLNFFSFCWQLVSVSEENNKKESSRLKEKSFSPSEIFFNRVQYH